jgi:hypothetical protein
MPFPVRGADGILHDIPESRISFWKDRLETDSDIGLPSRDILAECRGDVCSERLSLEDEGLPGARARSAL